MSQKQSLKRADLYNILDIREHNTANLVNIATLSDILCEPEIYLRLPDIRYRMYNDLLEEVFNIAEDAMSIPRQYSFQDDIKRAILSESNFNAFYDEISDFMGWMDDAATMDDDEFEEEYDSSRILYDLDNLLHSAKAGLAAVQDVETFTANVFAS